MQSARSMHGSFQRPCGAGISDGEGPAVRSDFRSPPGGGQKFAGLRHRGPAALACGDFFLAARVLGRVARNTTANSFGGSTSVARARDRIAQLFPGRCGAPPRGGRNLYDPSTPDRRARLAHLSANFGKLFFEGPALRRCRAGFAALSAIVVASSGCVLVLRRRVPCGSKIRREIRGGGGSRWPGLRREPRRHR
jgi:hypothetical protein